jgi:hypothetical protein
METGGAPAPARGQLSRSTARETPSRRGAFRPHPPFVLPANRETVRLPHLHKIGYYWLMATPLKAEMPPTGWEVATGARSPNPSMENIATRARLSAVAV